MANYQTIRQTARNAGLPEHHLRQLVKRGECPGFYAGTRFYVNVDALTEQLDRVSRSNAANVALPEVVNE